MTDHLRSLRFGWRRGAAVSGRDVGQSRGDGVRPVRRGRRRGGPCVLGIRPLVRRGGIGVWVSWL